MSRIRGLVALPILLSCGKPAEQAPESTRPSSGIRSSTDSLYAAGQFLEARRIWEAEALDAGGRGDSATLARLWTSIGLAERNLTNYSESRRLGERALALKLRLKLDGELFRSYNALGLLAWDQGLLDEATERFRQAAEAARAAGDSLGIAKAANNAALVDIQRGEPLRARDGFALLRDVSRRVGDSMALGRALLNLAMVDLQLGDPLAATAAVEEAREIARVMRDAEAEENALGQLATTYQALGQPHRAFAAIDSALALAQSRGLQRRVAEDLQLLGDFYAAAGDHRRALDQYDRAQQLNLALGLPEEHGNTLRAEARSYQALGHATAESRARRALAVHRSGGFAQAELADLLLLAELAAERRDGAGAMKALQEAAQSAAAVSTPIARAELGLVTGRVYDRLDRPAAVLAALDSAGPVLALIPEVGTWESDALRARAYAKLGRPDAAELAGRQAVAALERIRAAYGSGVLRTSYLSSRAEVYADLVIVLLARRRVEDAFLVADAARGRALLERVGTARQEAQRGGSLAQLLRADELLRRIDSLTSRLRAASATPPPDRGPGADAESRSLETRVAEARTEYEGLMTRVLREGSGRTELLGAAPHPQRVAAIQQALLPTELLLEYFVTRDRVHIFALGPRGLHHVVAPIAVGELISRVRLARDLVAQPVAAGTGVTVLRELHRVLIEPLPPEVLQGSNRLLLVPHGVLAYLPFAALADANGTPLVEQFALLLLPAASALPALREAERNAPGEPGKARTIAVAPFPEELPASRREVEDVRRATGGRTLLGLRATEAALRRELGRNAVVHVATHAELNALNPMFSRIELAEGEGIPGDGSDDGRLEVHELLSVRTAAWLVFLSGCQTGRGAAWRTGFEQGEDYVTLAQGFLYAGAANVVATLWRVNDPAAALFARRFYANLGTADPVEALAAAQVAMRRDPTYGAPYFWAGYQISGSGGFGPGELSGPAGRP